MEDNELTQSGGQIIDINIEDQMKTAYINYSMSVIVSRALPDVRDGLKPVHRRVLYGMYELGLFSNRPTKKSARIVGEVLGKYHPHGDSSVYDAMVRLAQPWSMRYPLVEGQGNFGSIDGDSPAAMRYTEAKLTKLAEEMLADLEKDTVDFQNNFDDSLKEPTVLPAKIPNLLLNGASGIAVGMATNMPPHNLSEVVDGIIAYIDNRDITVEELMNYIKGPDFPTGGLIYGIDGVIEAYNTGRGRVCIRGEAEIIEHNNKHQIIISSIPYQVNKSDLVQKMAALVESKKIDGITDIRDESDREGIRIVIDMRRDANANVILNSLYRFSPLQSTFSINNIALVNGKPETLNLIQLIHYYVEHRHEVIIRRSQYELNEAEKRAHILEGLLKALDFIDEVIAIIRSSETVEIAKNGLMQRFDFTDIQATAIIDMRLRTLTGLERDKLQSEYDELMKKIAYLKHVLSDENLQMQIIKDELLEIKQKYGDKPRTDIDIHGKNVRIEDLIADEPVVITISHLGYIKRTKLSDYRSQNRGGKGKIASDIRDEDFIENLYIATNHDYLLLFTRKGKVYWLRVFEIPEAARNAKGKPIQNLIALDSDDKIQTIINTKNLDDHDAIKNDYVIFITTKGIIKKTSLTAFARPRSTGIIALNIRDGDDLLQVALTHGKSEIVVATSQGKTVRFNEEEVRPMGRTAIGVKAITLSSKDDSVIGMVVMEDENQQILVISEKGYGKRSFLSAYRKTHRATKGIKAMNITEKTGKLISIIDVTNENDDIMLITKNGIGIRLNISNIRLQNRVTQGSRLIQLQNDDAIASVAKIAHDIDDDDTENIEAEISLEENNE
ncbi:MAG: DNA gyrase subunit A [Bacteroidales bacterium]|jgi:DNA gyrase subunit A|nr:DNA gyrase subunit A [Bacteroidales bacterium]MDI9576080.1 DNA gyrase subunit A [Bacteroidota bacterium]MDD2592727.1 DNA gyrase subunit A [Bacteroidales bacterium]MDD3754960.1 DNA gyrase subunit A [Bacteroidales bacterium]MDY0400310.1 DNA gyrase subunit A [Bacteroidales bacterium]